MPATRRSDQPWHSSLSLDLLLKVLNNSIFHPFVASLIPVCLRAAEIPFSAPAVRNSVYWAIFVCILHVLDPINQRIAYGKARWVEQDEEVVVITGGGSGLGRCLAEIFALKGTTVVVLDIKPADEEAVEGIHYYQCDIGDSLAVGKVWQEIKTSIGLPTILINNAGIVHGKLASQLTSQDISTTFRVNTVSQYTLNSLFLPPLLDRKHGGTIVTVSSVLAKLGAAQLSAYTASKAALLAYHSSLDAELAAYPNIKMILVTPGQLSTAMFSGMKQNPIQQFFGPIVEVQDLAIKIVKMISEGKGGLIAEPAYTRWISILDVLPVGFSKLLRLLAGVDAAMSTFDPNSSGKTIKLK